MKKMMKDIFLKYMFNTQKNYVKFIMTYHFYQKERKASDSFIWILNKDKKQTLTLTFVLTFFFFLLFFLSYCKHIANSPFWKLCECLTIPIKIILSIYSKISCLLVCKKINFITRFFKILQRNSKLVILGNLDMPGCTHPKW